MQLYIPPSSIERYNNNVVKAGPNDCWDWVGPTTTTGSGQFYCHVKNAETKELLEVCQTAHRMGWILANNEVPGKGVVVGRSCGNKLCQNPAHMYLTTHNLSQKNSWVGTKRDTTKKLNFEMAQQIRKEYIEEDTSMLKLARKWGLTYKTVNYILNGKTYPVNKPRAPWGSKKGTRDAE
jgi:hypothetical protein